MTATAELVHRAQAGDTDAFGQIYELNRPTVFRYVLGRVGNRQLAEDLTSDTFVRALRSLSRYQDQGKDIAAWLVTIARNLVFDHFKSHRYQREVLTADVLDVDLPDFRGPDQAALDTIQGDGLRQALWLLTPDQREVITCRYLRELSIRETATAMGREEGAVKALTCRAVRALAAIDRRAQP